MSDAGPMEWGVRSGMRVWIGGHDQAVRRLMAPLLDGTLSPPTGPLDAAVVTPLTWDEAAYFLAKLHPRLRPGAEVFVVSDGAAPVSPPESASDSARCVAGYAWFAATVPVPGLRADGFRR